MKRLEVTGEQFEEVNEWNRNITKEFLQQAHLSNETLSQYSSALKHFFVFIKDYCNNKPFYELKSRDALKYQNYLIERGLSSSSIKLKRAVVSSLSRYLEVYYEDEFPGYKNIFNQKVPNLNKSNKYEKVPLTQEEFELLVKELEKRQEWQMLAYVLFSYSSGCRRAEVRQLKKEVINYKPVNDKGYYMSHEVRGKGRTRNGKKLHLVFDQRAMDALKKWIEVRGEDDCEYMFVSSSVSKNKNSENVVKVKQISKETFNYWCSEIFSKILNKRVHPHLFRSTRATHLSLEGVDVRNIQLLLNHESPDTTNCYILRDSSELLNDIFK